MVMITVKMKKIDFLIIADALSRLVERLVLLLNRSVWKTAPMTAPAQMMTVQPYLFWRGLTAQALVLSLFRCATEILQGVHTLKKFVQAFGSQNTLNIEHQIKKNRASVYEILVLNMLIASIDISKCAFFN